MLEMYFGDIRNPVRPPSSPDHEFKRMAIDPLMQEKNKVRIH